MITELSSLLFIHLTILDSSRTTLDACCLFPVPILPNNTAPARYPPSHSHGVFFKMPILYEYTPLCSLCIFNYTAAISVSWENVSRQWDLNHNPITVIQTWVSLQHFSFIILVLRDNQSMPGRHYKFERVTGNVYWGNDRFYQQSVHLKKKK